MAVNHQNISLKLSEERLNQLVAFAKDYAVGHGLIMRTPSQPELSDTVDIVTLTLLPTPIKRTLFNFGKQIQTDYNHLYHMVAHNRDFLKDALESLRTTDDFIKRLWDIYESVQNENRSSSICLEISRSDYMIDSREDRSDMIIKQIEYNTIACSFAGLATQAFEYHKFLLEKIGRSDLSTHLPVNTAIDGLAEGMVTVWELYDSQEAVILFVTEPSPRNIFDVRRIEIGIQKVNPKIQVICTTFLELDEKATLAEDNKLMFNGQEVALVYYRIGYVPQDYTSEREWSVRSMIEHSKAVKCPSVPYQLAGMKKIQQVLSGSGMVERFIEDPDAAGDVRETFAKQYSLEGAEGEEAMKLAMENHDEYVLKPQREGGGNNIYGEDIVKCLNEIKDSEERRNYILMERIRPLVNHNYILKANAPLLSGETISEIGIFGVLISSGETILKNNSVGHLLRTKPCELDEGGVMTGFSAIDSPYLV